MYHLSDKRTLVTFSPMLFSENLRNLMEREGFTQDELSFEASISRQSLSKYMTGKALPKLEIIARLAYVLDVSIYDLIQPAIDFSYSVENDRNHSIPPSLSMKVDKWVDTDGLTSDQLKILLKLIEEFRKLNLLNSKDQ